MHTQCMRLTHRVLKTLAKQRCQAPLGAGSPRTILNIPAASHLTSGRRPAARAEDLDSDSQATVILHLGQPIDAAISPAMRGLLREVTSDGPLPGAGAHGEEDTQHRGGRKRHLQLQRTFQWSACDHLHEAGLLFLPVHTVQEAVGVRAHHEAKLWQARQVKGLRDEGLPQACLLQPPAEVHNLPLCSCASNTTDLAEAQDHGLEAPIFKDGTGARRRHGQRQGLAQLSTSAARRRWRHCGRRGG
mmetsp:Transcript_11372/g.23885  ORF Transcript_11372/g.23885 Transcript_11372/m.23885 type:complete len:245 (-) Transcript_11372:65-799(-)